MQQISDTGLINSVKILTWREEYTSHFNRYLGPMGYGPYLLLPVAAGTNHLPDHVSLVARAPQSRGSGFISLARRVKQDIDWRPPTFISGKSIFLPQEGHITVTTPSAYLQQVQGRYCVTRGAGFDDT